MADTEHTAFPRTDGDSIQRRSAIRVWPTEVMTLYHPVGSVSRTVMLGRVRTEIVSFASAARKAALRSFAFHVLNTTVTTPSPGPSITETVTGKSPSADAIRSLASSVLLRTSVRFTKSPCCSIRWASADRTDSPVGPDAGITIAPPRIIMRPRINKKITDNVCIERVRGHIPSTIWPGSKCFPSQSPSSNACGRPTGQLRI